MNSKAASGGLVLVLAFSSFAQGQVTIDASKITCDQFVHGKVGPTRSVGLWLSGFYNGRRDNVSFDPQRFQANLSKVERFCYIEKNFETPVLQAIEQVLGGAK